ncbi:MAG: glycosyltransferase [Deltaproteobacteria bacterium]|nr:glycosyltransferase [Deltaproteobacteria bacterium]
MPRVVRIQSRICVGGPALHTILLSEGLSRGAGSAYETVLISGQLEPGEAPMSTFAADRGVFFETVPEMRRQVHPVRDASALWSLVAKLKRYRPSIVHTHTAKAGAIGRLAARIAGVPFVVHTFHGHIFDGYFSKARVRAFVAAERALSRLSDCVIAISEQQRVDLVERYRVAPANKVRVIPLGLDLDRFRSISAEARSDGMARREIGLPANAPIVVSAGRLVPIKRYDLLVEAFSGVLSSLPDAHLVIVGDGTEAERSSLLDLVAKLGVSNRVHFPGWRRDVERVYAESDLFALTSDNEGTPVSLIEALASGIPAVSTDVGGVRDVLRPELGEVVARGDVAAIRRAIVSRLVGASGGPDRLRDDLRDDVVRRFSHHRLIRDITNLYDELLGSKALAMTSIGAQQVLRCGPT